MLLIDAADRCSSMPLIRCCCFAAVATTVAGGSLLLFAAAVRCCCSLLLFAAAVATILMLMLLLLLSLLIIPLLLLLLLMPLIRNYENRLIVYAADQFFAVSPSKAKRIGVSPLLRTESATLWYLFSLWDPP